MSNDFFSLETSTGNVLLHKGHIASIEFFERTRPELKGKGAITLANGAVFELSKEQVEEVKDWFLKPLGYGALPRKNLIKICEHFEKSLDRIAENLNESIVAYFGDKYEYGEGLESYSDPSWNRIAEMRREANLCLYLVQSGTIFSDD